MDTINETNYIHFNIFILKLPSETVLISTLMVEEEVVFTQSTQQGVSGNLPIVRCLMGVDGQ